MRHARLRTLRALSLCLAIVVAGCGSDDGFDEPLFTAPEMLVDYDIEINGLPTEEMEDTAESALTVYQRRDDGAQSIPFLRRRAQSDEPTFQKLLRSQGYYTGTVEVTVTEVFDEKDEAQDDAAVDTPPTTEPATDTADGEEKKKQRALVVFDITPGPQFTLTSHEMPIEARGKAPEIDPKALGSPVGGPAIAEKIVDAETRAVTRLRDAGFPYTNLGDRRAVADLDNDTIEVTSPLDAGPLSVFGGLTFTGLEEVEEEYLRTYLDFDIGQTFSQKELEDYQADLLATDLFDSLSVLAPEQAPDGEAPVALPITITAEEREKRTIAASVRYNTDDGPSVLGSYENRNLFGANETFGVEAEAGFEIQRLTFGYREPQYLRDGQDFVAGFDIRREDNDAYDADTATLSAGIERKLTPKWTVGAGGLAEASKIRDPVDGDSTSYLGGIPTFAEYDGSNDLLNPTKGIRFRADVTPFAGIFDDEFVQFLSLDTRGSTYFDLTGEEKYIFATRGRLGSIISESIDNVPDNRRLYSGGGGSVRGYGQRLIGPLDADDDPTGGLSVVELSGEFRAKLYGDIGGVVFVDGGAVSEEVFPSFDDGFQVAAGFGFRYYSPAGPIRVDIAFPLNGRPVDDAFQFYFSIGQAF